METKIYTVELTFTEKLLGTAPADAETYTNYIIKKADVVTEEVKEETDTLPEPPDTGPLTVFHRLDGVPAIYNYALRGYFKEVCGDLRRIKDTKSSSPNLRAYKKVLNGLLFITPRLVPIHTNEPISFFERPLRASTPMGERVALTKSEAIEPGATMKFNIKVLGDKVKEDTIREWLDYGQLKGMGQWRSGGFGTFTYELQG